MMANAFIKLELASGEIYPYNSDDFLQMKNLEVINVLKKKIDIF